MSERALADWDEIAGVPTRDQRYIDLGDWEIDQAIEDIQAQMPDLGEIPLGATLESFITTSKGATKETSGTYVLAHGGDTITINGGKSGILINVVQKDRSRSKTTGPFGGVAVFGSWGGWKTKSQDIALQAGETRTIKNLENGETTDTDIFVKLVDVLKTATEVEAERKQAELDKTLSDPTATAEAKRLAQVEYDAAMKQVQADSARSQAQASAAGVAATGAAIESIVWPIVIIGGAGMTLLLAWLYLGREKMEG